MCVFLCLQQANGYTVEVALQWCGDSFRWALPLICLPGCLCLPLPACWAQRTNSQHTEFPPACRVPPPSFLPAATRSSGLSTASRPLMAAPTSTVPRLRSRGWVRGGVGGLWLHACMKKAGAEAVEGSRVAESGYMSVYCCSCLPLPPCSEQRCAQGQAAEGGGVQPGWGVHPRGAGHGGVGQGGCVDVWVAGCVPVAWAW